MGKVFTEGLLYGQGLWRPWLLFQRLGDIIGRAENRKRGIIEAINDQLKNISQIGYIRPRSLTNYKDER